MRIKSCNSEMRSGHAQRKKLWEIPFNLHCSICGTCMSVEEQRKILKKLNVYEKGYRDYELHSLFVNSLNHLNRLSRMVNEFLDHKYRREIANYGHLQEQELAAIWWQKAAEGDVCGLYWVAVSKADLSEEILNLIIGEVHMMSHLNGDICRRERMKLKQLEEEKLKLKRRVHHYKGTEKEWKSELEAAKVCIGKIEKQLQELQSKNITCIESNSYQEAIDSLKTENEDLRLKLKENIARVQDYKKQYKQVDRERAQLEREVLQQKDTIMQLCREIKVMAGCQVCCRAGTVADEEIQSIKGRLLLVGGNCGLNKHYRNIIENMGWEFRYHDGCLSGGRQSLIERLKWSDLILCSLDVNSHGAVNTVKEYAGKLQKEYRLLDNSSLSGVARALTEHTEVWPA